MFNQGQRSRGSSFTGPLIHFLQILLLLVIPILETQAKSQYVLPISTGMKMSIPYDIANVLIRPIGGVTGFILTIALGVILFFGVITSPFGYFFGIPSRKYVMGGAPDHLHTQGRKRRSWSLEGGGQGQEDVDALGYPTFTQSLFYFMKPEDMEDPSCQYLVICYSHGGLQYLPRFLVRFYGMFSTRLHHLTPEIRFAIIQGISDNSKCSELYSQCPEPVFGLVIKSLLNFLPESFKNENFRKRKQDMYLYERE